MHNANFKALNGSKEMLGEITKVVKAEPASNILLIIFAGLLLIITLNYT